MPITSQPVAIAVVPDAVSIPDSGTFAAAWPLPVSIKDHLQLETRAATLLYWLGLSLVASTLFISKLLPCVDYPQHLALSDVARRLEDPNAPEHATHQISYFTYNGLFHFTVAKLSKVLPIELAGRIVLAGSLLLLGAAVVALLRVLRRPPSYAALFTPIVFSFSVVWGFANYALGSAIALVTLVFVARTLIRPTIGHVAAVASLGLLCAFAHVLAMLILCAMALAIAPEIAWRATAGNSAYISRFQRLSRAAARIVLALAPLLIGCLFCIAVYREQYDWDPNMYRDPTMEGTAPPIWQKILLFCSFATDLHSDHTDFVLLLTSVLIMCVLIYLARRERRRGDAHDGEPPPLYLPFVLMTGVYLATPMVLIGTHLIFPRLAQSVLIGAILAVPALGGKVGARMRKYALVLGVATGINLVAHTICFAYETNDASRVIDDLPEGRNATAVIWEPATFAFRPGTLTHLAAYYGARKHGGWAFSFARYLSVPVRYRPNTQPAWPQHGWEFEAWNYDPRCKYARAFDLVLVKAPPDISTGAAGEKALRHRVFGKDEFSVKLLSHHGEYWAFDTAGLPSDGAY